MTAQGVRITVGLILFVQGIGSAITDAVWHSSFGVAGLLRAAGAPEWTELTVGGVGAALLIWAMIVWRVRA
ncbi:hypothetical protein [Kutzneria sp. NPDC052558]|uniref:hypothetical protein n=1 Tax=Kutzneria sp. NPDC052558 TaxID=3364121 RepID=UPI0037CCB248